MKKLLKIILALTLLLTLNRLSPSAFAQGTAFTYQGQLQNNGSPANGTYVLTFSLYTTNTGGTAVAGPVTNSAVAVSNGLFAATIDFGSSVWNGQTNWLEIGVETNNATSFNTLAPRQQITPIPYAITAENVENLPASQLTSIGNTNGGVGNFFVGPSGNAATSGYYNTANGIQALNDNTSGQDNTANGYEALWVNTSGSDNTANGMLALRSNTTGYGNTADGSGALQLNVSGTENTAIGGQALQANQDGEDNTAIGYQAMWGNNSGSFNTANGNLALWIVNGNQNTAIGYSSLYKCRNGANNTAVGCATLTGTQGTNDIAIGYEAGTAFTNSESSNIDIGNVGVAGESSIIRIGTPGIQTATYLSGTVYANGVALTSDRNAKENFSPINTLALLDKVAALPITQWNYKSDKTAEHIGPMAQDFKVAFGLDGADDKHISVVDEGGVALAAVQGLNQKLESDNAELKRENNLLAKRLDELQAEVKTLAQNSH